MAAVEGGGASACAFWVKWEPCLCTIWDVTQGVTAILAPAQDKCLLQRLHCRIPFSSPSCLQPLFSPWSLLSNTLVYASNLQVNS